MLYFGAWNEMEIWSFGVKFFIICVLVLFFFINKKVENHEGYYFVK